MVKVCRALFGATWVATWLAACGPDSTASESEAGSDSTRQSGSDAMTASAVPAGSDVGSASADAAGAGATTGPASIETGSPGPALPAAEEDCERDAGCEPQPEPADDHCGALVLETDVQWAAGSANLMLVYDRSGSMGGDWDGRPRWEVLGAELRHALTSGPAASSLGAVFFPSADPSGESACIDPSGSACEQDPDYVAPTGNCDVRPIADADQVDFVPREAFLASLDDDAGRPPHAPVPRGRTPLLAALQQVDAALAAAPTADSTAVLIITDGAPDCGWDMNAAWRYVEAWYEDGIETHAIGLPGSEGTSFVLSGLVGPAGGRVTYVSDAETLGEVLSERLAANVRTGFESCTVGVAPAPDPTAPIHLVVREAGSLYVVPRDLGDGGWRLAADGTSAELVGSLCDAARDGRFQSLELEMGCVDLPAWSPR
jgi:hypothetical protein